MLIALLMTLYTKLYMQTLLCKHTHTHRTWTVSSMTAGTTCDTKHVLMTHLSIYEHAKHSHIQTDHSKQLTDELGDPKFLQFSIHVHSPPGRN